MKLLLDTHAWLWFHLGDPQLSAAARQHILDPGNAKFLSPASFWESSIKISLGKYVLCASGEPRRRPAAGVVGPVASRTVSVAVRCKHPIQETRPQQTFAAWGSSGTS